ncbi:MAG: hypothetical protein Q4P18_04835 [Methanobrevibacter sp.]|uniref:hypothetical protein n=1 Tax=Methanobrevibacter sp. TaxID=66852 RepID=UPI0026DF9902|nr:hypothetical protein [Methanobrevibacter sp.]MDO5848837.1 hypothetical protein [Methanobrevibacter sp.]
MISDFNFDGHDKFFKEKSKFVKRCPSMEKDFERFKIALTTDIRNNDYEVPTDNNKYFKIQGLSKKVYLPVFVVKRFYCEKMNRGANSGFRITFVYNKAEKSIYFVEMYFKSKDEIEDKERINGLF